MNGSVVRIALAVVSVVGASAPVLLSATPAAGVATCSYNANTDVVAVSVGSGETAVIHRDGDAIEVSMSSCLSPGLVPATVFNTDLIDVNGGAGTQNVGISLVFGTFAPGDAAEAGSSDEIEFDFALGAGSDFLTVGGAPGNDRIRYGVASGVPKVNLNANETDGIDADVTAAGVDVFFGAGNQGNDAISGMGGRGTGAEFSMPMTLSGSIGNDKLTGGTAADTVTDTDSSDADVLKGRGGGDTLNASDLDTLDSLFGGPGVDTCSSDPGDLLDSC